MTTPADDSLSLWRRVLVALLTAARSTGRLLGRVLGALATRLRQMWRASLQFRVVLMTMLLCTLVMTLIQVFIYQRVSDGLVEARINSAKDEAINGERYITARVEAADNTDTATMLQVALSTMRQLESQEASSVRQLILTQSPTASTGQERLPTSSTGPDLSAVPVELRDALAADPGFQQVMVAPLEWQGSTASAVFVAQRTMIGSTPCELYVIFPLTREQQTLAMIQRTFLLGSFVFVLLIGVVAYAVTRFVVDPVREAAVIAGRLSSGHLNERMRVRGADDLATLATSFNNMADHLQQQISALEDLSAVQQRFVSDVSHELRTPLTTIHMAADMIYDDRDHFSPATARSAELLYGEVERFEMLLGDLLEISRFDAGAAHLEHDDTDLRSVVDRVIASSRTLAEAKGSALEVVGDDVPHRAEIDARRVERILRNLVTNAIEHGEGRPVTITLGSTETAVAVVVSDEGIGLRPGDADLVFNRFWRADPARKRTTGGTGLGLAIAMEDARLHDGWLQAWGELGVGSRFRLVLPKTAGRPIGLAPISLEPPVAPPADEPAPDLYAPTVVDLRELPRSVADSADSAGGVSKAAVDPGLMASGSGLDPDLDGARDPASTSAREIP